MEEGTSTCVSTARQGGAGSLLEDELGWKPVWWNTLPAGWGAGFVVGEACT